MWLVAGGRRRWPTGSGRQQRELASSAGHLEHTGWQHRAQGCAAKQISNGSGVAPCKQGVLVLVRQARRAAAPPQAGGHQGAAHRVQVARGQRSRQRAPTGQLEALVELIGQSLRVGERRPFLYAGEAAGVELGLRRRGCLAVTPLEQRLEHPGQELAATADLLFALAPAAAAWVAAVVAVAVSAGRPRSASSNWRGGRALGHSASVDAAGTAQREATMQGVDAGATLPCWSVRVSPTVKELRQPRQQQPGQARQLCPKTGWEAHRPPPPLPPCGTIDDNPPSPNLHTHWPAASSRSSLPHMPCLAHLTATSCSYSGRSTASHCAHMHGLLLSRSSLSGRQGVRASGAPACT